MAHAITQFIYLSVESFIKRHTSRVIWPDVTGISVGKKNTEAVSYSWPTLLWTKKSTDVKNKFNRHQISLVVRKCFLNQPWLHTQNNIHTCIKSTQWRTLSLCQFDDPLKIPHRHIVLHFIVHENACTWRIKWFLVAISWFLSKKGQFHVTNRSAYQFSNRIWCDSS